MQNESWIVSNPDKVVHPIGILPGPHDNYRINKAPLYLPEKEFTYFTTLFTKHPSLSSFSHYAYTEIPANIWESMVKDLQQWAFQVADGAGIEELKPTPGFLFKDSREEFLDRENENLQKLKATSEELSDWIEKQLVDHEVISILGM